MTKFTFSVSTIPDAENCIPNTINTFPVASALFEDTEIPSYDLSSSTPVPAHINELASQVNRSPVLPISNTNTNSNESKYKVPHEEKIRRRCKIKTHIFPVSSHSTVLFFVNRRCVFHTIYIVCKLCTKFHGIKPSIHTY